MAALGFSPSEMPFAVTHSLSLIHIFVYFLTVIGVFLFLSVQSLEKRRWSE